MKDILLPNCEASTSTSTNVPHSKWDIKHHTPMTTTPSTINIPKMIALSTILLILLLPSPATAQFCPTPCLCNNDQLSVVCDNGDLTSIPMLLNPRTRSLSMKGNRLTAVTVDELSFYTHLLHLDLANNQIATIEKDTFYRLSQLTTLKLNDNSMPSLTTDVFAGLSSLRHLDVSNNKLSTVATNSFIDMQHLRSLNLSYNAIDNVSSNAFAGLDRLTTLDMQQNFVMEITPRTLESLPKLQHFDMAYNRIGHLVAGLFAHSPHLLDISVANNRLEVIDDAAFDGLTTLKQLDLSSNQLDRIPSLALARLSELKSLDLSANQFDVMSTSCLEGLASLTILRIDSCPLLRTIEINAFSGLQELTTLSVTHNVHLAFIDEMAFERPNRLRHVMLNDNALTTLPPTLLDWQQVEVLALSNNRWSCTCEQTLWLRAHSRMSVLASTAVCASPVELHAQSLPAWSSSACYMGERTAFVVRLVLVIGAAAICLLIVLLLVCCFSERLFTFVHSARSTNTRYATLSTQGDHIHSSSAIMRTSPYSDDSYYEGGKTPPTDILRFMPPTMKHVQQVQQQHMYVQRRLSDHHNQQTVYRTYTPSLCATPTPSVTYQPLTVVTQQQYNQRQLQQQQQQQHQQLHNSSVNTSETDDSQQQRPQHGYYDDDEPCYASIPIYGEVHMPQAQQRQQEQQRQHEVYTPNMSSQRNDSSYRVISRYPVPLTEL